jgi:hypothetical protein
MIYAELANSWLYISQKAFSAQKFQLLGIANYSDRKAGWRLDIDILQTRFLVEPPEFV